MNPYPVCFEPFHSGFAPPFHPPPPPFPNSIRYPLPFFPDPTTCHPPFPHGSFTPCWDHLGVRGRGTTWRRGQKRRGAAGRGYRQRVSRSNKSAHPWMVGNEAVLENCPFFQGGFGPRFAGPTVSAQVFECSTCQRSYRTQETYQGHLDSHMKVRRCWIARNVTIHVSFSHQLSSVMYVNSLLYRNWFGSILRWGSNLCAL